MFECRPTRICLLYAILAEKVYSLYKSDDVSELEELLNKDLWGFYEENVRPFICKMKRSNYSLHHIAREPFVEAHKLMKTLDEGALQFEITCNDSEKNKRSSPSPWKVGQFFVMANYFQISISAVGKILRLQYFRVARLV